MENESNEQRNGNARGQNATDLMRPTACCEAADFFVGFPASYALNLTAVIPRHFRSACAAAPSDS